MQFATIDYIVFGAYAALIVFLGVYPKPMLQRIEPAIDELVAHVDEFVVDWDEPTADHLDTTGGVDGSDEEHE